MSGRPTLVIGVGNRDRGDDAAGPEVCDRVAMCADGSTRTVVSESSAIDLAVHWDADDRVVVVDAGRPDGSPGRVTVYDGVAERCVVPATASTHSVDVSGGVEVARALGRLPATLTIIAIEGASFEFGAPLTEPVRRSVDRVAAELA